MNVYLFGLIFISIGIVPLMIIKGKTDESPKIKLLSFKNKEERLVQIKFSRKLILEHLFLPFLF